MEPLISTALFERVQEILEGRYSTKDKKSPNTIYILRSGALWALRLRPRRREEERQIRLLPLYRQQRKMLRTMIMCKMAFAY